MKKGESKISKKHQPPKKNIKKVVIYKDVKIRKKETQHNLLKILSELGEDKMLDKNEFEKDIGISWDEIKRQLNLLQDDGMLEWESEGITQFSFRITANGDRFLDKTS